MRGLRLTKKTGDQLCFFHSAIYQLYTICRCVFPRSYRLDELGATKVNGHPIINGIAADHPIQNCLMIGCRTVRLAVIVWASTGIYKAQPITEGSESSEGIG